MAKLNPITPTDQNTEYLFQQLPASVIHTFDMVSRYIQMLKDTNNFSSCHQVSNEISVLLDSFVVYQTGVFDQYHQHSWLLIKNHERYLIDPYPVAMIGGPILLDKAPHLIIPTPWNHLYKTK